jgi:N-acyl-D-aspartate/D-glutamate deacylase
MGELERPATPTEISRMANLIASALDDGAVGLSFGFEYFPGRSAGTDEAVALAARMKRGVVAMHTRGLASLYLDGMTEAIDIGRRSGRPIQLSHVNPLGRAHRAAADRLPDLVAAARRDGIDVNLDAVTYTTWKNDWLSLFPAAVSESYGRDGVRSLAATEDGRKRLQTMVEQCVPAWPSWASGAATKNPIVDTGWDDLVLCETVADHYRDMLGHSVASIAREHGRAPFDVICDLITSDPDATSFLNAWVSGDMDDDEPMQRIFRAEGVIPATDATPNRGPGGAPALDMPNAFGTMPRFLGRFCRDLGVLSLEDAIWRMTALPASWLGLARRGQLREGWVADLVAFSPSAIADAGTLLRPESPLGVEWVFVNGVPVVRDGRLAQSSAGRYVRADGAG